MVRLFAQAPIRSRHRAARVRNGTTQQADRSNERQQNCVRLTESQTHQVVPQSSSLVYGTAPVRAARRYLLTGDATFRWAVAVRDKVAMHRSGRTKDSKRVALTGAPRSARAP